MVGTRSEQRSEVRYGQNLAKPETLVAVSAKMGCFLLVIGIRMILVSPCGS